MHKINSNKQEYKTNRAEYVQFICSYHMISKELNSVNATFNREKYRTMEIMPDLPPESEKNGFPLLPIWV